MTDFIIDDGLHYCMSRFIKIIKFKPYHNEKQIYLTLHSLLILLYIHYWYYSIQGKKTMLPTPSFQFFIPGRTVTNSSTKWKNFSAQKVPPTLLQPPPESRKKPEQKLIELSRPPPRHKDREKVVVARTKRRAKKPHVMSGWTSSHHHASYWWLL